MTQHTARDKVWNHALRYALVEESFKISRIEDEIAEPPSLRTIRDTLNTMVNYGWLIKNSPQAHTWHPGPKAIDADLVEESFNGPSMSTRHSSTCFRIDDVVEKYSDRVSNSGNVVIENVGAAHALGTHGPLEEYIKIPFVNGDPLRVKLPRLRPRDRVLVCREQSIIRGDDGVEMVRQPELQTDDIVPVSLPLCIKRSGGLMGITPEDTDEIPLPLFSNADTLTISDDVEIKPGIRYALKIDSISDRTASGSVYEQAESTPSTLSTDESLDDIAEVNYRITKL